MLTETTVSKLREMRLSVMANAPKDQLADPQFQSMAFEDRLGLLVDAEWNARKNNHLNKLIRQAYWRPAEIASKGPARKANCGAKEKAITEFFQILYTEQ